MILVPESQIREYTSHGWRERETLIDKLYSRAKSEVNKEVLVDPDYKEKLVGLPLASNDIRSSGPSDR